MKHQIEINVLERSIHGSPLLDFPGILEVL